VCCIAIQHVRAPQIRVQLVSGCHRRLMGLLRVSANFGTSCKHKSETDSINSYPIGRKISI
jgi:hypothetical protein